MRVVTSDNEEFTVDGDIIHRMGIFAAHPDEQSNSDGPLPLPNVSSSVFKKVLEYCEYHRDEPPVLASDENNDDPRKRQVIVIGEWDQKFFQVDQEMLFEIILAANYLDIKPLLDVGCKTVAQMIRDKTPGEIRKLFNITSGFTPEEEAQILKENASPPRP